VVLRKHTHIRTLYFQRILFGSSLFSWQTESVMNDNISGHAFIKYIGMTFVKESDEIIAVIIIASKCTVAYSLERGFCLFTM